MSGCRGRFLDVESQDVMNAAMTGCQGAALSKSTFLASDPQDVGNAAMTGCHGAACQSDLHGWIAAGCAEGFVMQKKNSQIAKVLKKTEGLVYQPVSPHGA